MASRTVEDGVRAEDERQFERYVAVRGPALLRLAFVLTGDAHLAEDLVQNALTDTYRHWRRVRKAGHPDAYVRRILVNAHLTWCRRRSAGERPAADLPDLPDRRDATDAVLHRDALRRLLATLPARSRTVLVLRYYAELDDAAIGALLGLQESSVRSTASRALAILRAGRDPGAAPARLPDPEGSR